MKRDEKTGTVSVSVDEVTVYNMLLVESLIELVVEKGILTNAEILQRLEKLKAETKVLLSKPN
jgi:hypothetical protein